MKTKLIAITSAFFLTICSLQLSAQEQEAYKDGLFKRFGVAVKAGTYGYGLDFHTSLTPNLKARVGFNHLSLNYDEIYDFNADDVNGNIDPGVDGTFSNARLKFPNANILLDFYPVKSGIFCITAGAYIGNNKIDVDGTAEAPFLWDDIIVTPNPQGKFDGTLKMGNTIKPYLGFGLGRTISKSRLSCRFDIGVVYQGKYTIESPQASGTADGATVLKNQVDISDGLTDVLKLWPMMSFSISYRIK